MLGAASLVTTRTLGLGRRRRVARDSVYRWIEGRGLPAHKIGRLWKFKLSKVGEWVRACGADANN